MNSVLDNFDLTKPNILLCQEAHASYELIEQITKATENTGIKNYLLFLPLPVTHYTKFESEFKAKVLEYDNPFIFTQSQEFLKTILKLDGTIMGVLPIDFNIVQVYLNNNVLSYITYTKEKAYQLMINEGIDLRNVVKQGVNT